MQQLQHDVRIFATPGAHYEGTGEVAKVNVGCGRTPTKGWLNFDNSPSLRLARFPLVARLLRASGVLDEPQYAFIQFARANSIAYGDAASGLPLRDESVDVLYSSHMFEHLDRTEASAFLKEARRVLRAGGILRLSVPDLRLQVGQYLESNDADAFVAATALALPRAKTFTQVLKLIFGGNSSHRWMYDGDSLKRLLESVGFEDVQVMQPGKTTIEEPAALDLCERAAESVYLEARKPTSRP